MKWTRRDTGKERREDKEAGGVERRADANRKNKWKWRRETAC